MLFVAFQLFPLYLISAFLAHRYQAVGTLVEDGRSEGRATEVLPFSGIP